MLESLGGGYVPRNHIRWRELGERVMLGDSLWLAPQMLQQNPVFFLQNLSQGRVGAYSWTPRDFTELPRQQTLSARPTFEVGNTKLGSPWLWGEHHESSRGRAPARKDHEGCFGCERQGVHILRGRHCWRNWCGGPESWGDGEGFIPHWSASSGWQFWARLPSLSQFTLSAVRVNLDVTWSRDEVLVSSYTFAPYILRGLCASNLFTVSVHHPEWDVSADSVSLFQLGQIAREL